MVRLEGYMVRGNMTTVRVKAEELAGANHQITGIWYNPDSVHYKSVSLSWRPLRLPGFFLSLSAGLCQEVRAGQCLVRGSLLPAHTPGRVPVWGEGAEGQCAVRQWVEFYVARIRTATVWDALSRDQLHAVLQVIPRTCMYTCISCSSA